MGADIDEPALYARVSLAGFDALGSLRVPSERHVRANCPMSLLKGHIGRTGASEPQAQARAAREAVATVGGPQGSWGR